MSEVVPIRKRTPEEMASYLAGYQAGSRDALHMANESSIKMAEVMVSDRIRLLKSMLLPTEGTQDD